MTTDADDQESDSDRVDAADDPPEGREEILAMLSARSLSLPVEPTETDAEFAVDSTRSPETVFPQSVASGGPTDSGVILWTRIDPDAHVPDESLRLEIARDEDFADVEFRGEIDAEHVEPAHDYTVNVETDGLLDAGEFYFYRFVYDEVQSRTGRCRTLPDADASPDGLTLAVLTCQDYENGYYGAYHHIAKEDVDFMVHLGDFIYESAAGHYKTVFSREYPDRDLSLPSGHELAWSLDDFRYLHRTYRTDRFLQAALERHTLIAGWDDHEIADDRYWHRGVNAPLAPNHPRGNDPTFMKRLTADGMQAWWEYLPTRVEYDADAERLHERFRIWRHFEFGDLVDLWMTEGRLFRDAPPDDGLLTHGRGTPTRENPDRTMLGEDQRAWFLDGIRHSDAQWTVWGTEVVTIPLKFGASVGTVYPKQDGWDGFNYERQRILDTVRESDVRNFVALTGDMHCYLAGYHQSSYRDVLVARLDESLKRLGATLERLNGRFDWLERFDFDRFETEPGERIGVELMTPAISSITVGEAAGLDRKPVAGWAERALSWFVRAQNPHMEFFDSHHCGYALVEFTREECIYTGYSVDKTVNEPDAPKEIVTRVRVPDERVEIEVLARPSERDTTL